MQPIWKQLLIITAGKFTLEKTDLVFEIEDMQFFLTRFFVGVTFALSMATLIYVFIFPMPSMETSRDGIPHFTPDVIDPLTGKTLEIKMLVKHYKGE